MESKKFNKEAYKEIVKIVKFRFYEQLKNTGISIEGILEATDMVSKKEFYILILSDQETKHHIRFRESKSLLIQLVKIFEMRLKVLKMEENELLTINDTEAYGEDRYFDETEQIACALTSIPSLLEIFTKNLK
ncbi:MAG: hypothetical protein R8N23_20010 [Reichenbachiella sp.]|uniref:hypothetical protein n=1 Tax=Reichenbachiella sp. TaxID=2184521 RepID=UPI00296653E2|nr:hypothetical protein [Reichenbachiella sp.]MDW3212165.1 hypothetical protein [Reichenbachiella sp.]